MITESCGLYRQDRRQSLGRRRQNTTRYAITFPARVITDAPSDDEALVWLEKSTWTSYQWRGSEKGDDDSSSSSDASDHEAQEANGGPARAKVRSATFEISLQVLIECLNVFSESASGSGMKGGGRASTSGLDEEAGMTSTRGPKTSAVFSYAGEGEPFVIMHVIILVQSQSMLTVRSQTRSAESGNEVRVDDVRR